MSPVTAPNGKPAVRIKAKPVTGLRDAQVKDPQQVASRIVRQEAQRRVSERKWTPPAFDGNETPTWRR